MTSKDLFEKACRVIPGGVNSPVRAFNAVGGNPVYVAGGKGSHILTVEGREMVDFCGSWGPLILGHAREAIVEAVAEAARLGTSFGINTAREVEMAETLCRLVPTMDKVRLVSSGTEAVMTAIRLARGFTGRSRIIKFDGGYHGHSDALLVSAGSGLLTAGRPSSAGVPAAVAADTLVAPYNDCAALEMLADKHKDKLAAIIVEPVAGNMGLVPGTQAFLRTLRDVTRHHGALLIFDEVITGFRLCAGAYSSLCGIEPDLTCLGKIVGGGLPIGAVGGKREIMDRLAPLGDVYQAGTLSGNPVAVAAGLATLNILESHPPYEALAHMGQRISSALSESADKHDVQFCCQSLGGMFTPFFRNGPISNMADARDCDTTLYAGFFQSLLADGVYLPPSQFEVAFVSVAHDETDIALLIQAADSALAQLGVRGA